MKRRYVAPGPKVMPRILPKDEWRGGIFVEADGTVLEVRYSGKHMPQTEILRSDGSHRKVGHPVVRIA